MPLLKTSVTFEANMSCCYVFIVYNGPYASFCFKVRIYGQNHKNVHDFCFITKFCLCRTLIDKIRKTKVSCHGYRFIMATKRSATSISISVSIYLVSTRYRS